MEIFVNVGPVEKRIAIVKDGKLADFFLEREGLEHYAGSVYKGKVSSIVRGIDAAFIDIGLGKNGFLHADDVLDKESALKDILSDEEADRPPSSVHHKHGREPRINEVLKTGDEIMVQVVKEAIGTKGPRVTSFVSIPGRYLVLTPFDSHIGVSRRIRDGEKRRKIREMIENIRSSEKVGCIVRTMAENITEDELRQEMRYLISLWRRVKERAVREKAPVVVYEEYGAVLKMIRDTLTDEVKELVIDSRDEYARIMKFLNAFRPAIKKKIRLYNGKAPLFQKYDLDKQIDAIYERKVSLRSGGYLVIEQTEGLVAIDVNTGSFTGRKNLEDTAYKTNLESAREIPRQLMLRDIGGIIVIDFIDMEEKKHRDSVFNVLQDELKRDKARISVRSISQFGVVEMTRQRRWKSLESTSHVECPYCRGKGVIKSAETVAIETVRKLDKMLSTIVERRKHLVVTTHPEIHAALVSDQAKMLGDIQRKHRCKIELKEDASFHREEVEVNKK